jgi:hypothetical protein
LGLLGNLTLKSTMPSIQAMRHRQQLLPSILKNLESPLGRGLHNEESILASVVGRRMHISRFLKDYYLYQGANFIQLTCRTPLRVWDQSYCFWSSKKAFIDMQNVRYRIREDYELAQCITSFKDPKTYKNLGVGCPW